ncbi:DUF2062 domain-containing protein [Halioxenophilus aromaticivorans]|uniref:DUF2062 domain-containing protein n=1 Tax=Halioxenophilus aromaticivorans TaxID=1306992 RepID=A0AAV3TX55_9ALTE
MPRKLLKRWIPSPDQLQQKQSNSVWGKLWQDPNLFHLNRHSVSVAFFLGLFIAFIPAPGQMALGAFCAWFFRCNLPITLALIWVSNPLTMAPIFFFTYKLGTWILDTPVRTVESGFNWQWITTEISLIWQPLLVGSLLTGLFCGCLGYTTIKVFWRWYVIRNWHRRQRARSQQK